MVPRADEVRQAVAGSFLAALNDVQIQRLLVRSIVVDARAGSTIIDEGDPQSCGIIMRGLARVYVVTPLGSQLTVRRAEDGSAIGFAALADCDSVAFVQAITDCRFLSLDAASVVALGRSDPAVGWAIAEEVTRRLLDTYAEFGSATSGSVRQRVARALLDLAAPDHLGALYVRASQHRIAEMLGAARESVGHELRLLGTQGLIEQRRGSIAVLQPTDLDSVASDFTAARERVRPVSQWREMQLSNS